MRGDSLKRRTRALLRRLMSASRPVHPETAAALERRWSQLPAHVRTPSQLLGRHTTGCEGTHGVFPRCDLACTPCYHAKEAQRIRTDVPHTLGEVGRQMEYLRRVRGPGQHAQLIGGEVTLLGAHDHARALEVMQRHDRKPASMTHGDFDYDYLRDLAVRPDGSRRFDFLRFAAHFDSNMLGRRGMPRPRSEADLDEHRRRFVGHFERLRRDHGVGFDLAHNMTVTPKNLDQVASVVGTGMSLQFGMMSFQPAARVGNPRRWREDYGAVGIDDVWREIERGAGTRLPWRHLQVGDPRCNRTAYGILAGGTWAALLEDDDPRDLAVRDRFLDFFGGMDFDRSRAQVAGAVAHVVVRHPSLIPIAAAWAARMARRIGWRRLLAGRPRGFTFVVHAFMDAHVVEAAWAALERGETASDATVRAAQERLEACSYAMAHPDDDRLVPACVQHSILDRSENAALLELLPMRRSAADSGGARTTIALDGGCCGKPSASGVFGEEVGGRGDEGGEVVRPGGRPPRSGGRQGGGVPPKLEEVVGGVGQAPFRAGGRPAAA